VLTCGWGCLTRHRERKKRLGDVSPARREKIGPVLRGLQPLTHDQVPVRIETDYNWLVLAVCSRVNTPAESPPADRAIELGLEPFASLVVWALSIDDAVWS
jgi:hypothetical protein